MTIDSEIEQAMKEGAPPLFLVGMVTLATKPENRQLLFRAVNRVGTRLHTQAEEKSRRVVGDEPNLEGLLSFEEVERVIEKGKLRKTRRKQ